MSFKKYEKLNRKHLRKLCEAGWNNKQMADFFGISEGILYRWRRKYPDFSEKMDDWKSRADARVERSCYESAMGYSHPHEEIHIIKDRVVRVQTIKHYPPNSVAQIFWLTNRKHGDWKRTRQETGADPLSVKIMTMIKNNGGGNGKEMNRNKDDTSDVTSAVTIERGMKIVD